MIKNKELTHNYNNNVLIISFSVAVVFDLVSLVHNLQQQNTAAAEDEELRSART